MIMVLSVLERKFYLKLLGSGVVSWASSGEVGAQLVGEMRGPALGSFLGLLEPLKARNALHCSLLRQIPGLGLALLPDVRESIGAREHQQQSDCQNRLPLRTPVFSGQSLTNSTFGYVRLTYP